MFSSQLRENQFPLSVLIFKPFYEFIGGITEISVPYSNALLAPSALAESYVGNGWLHQSSEFIILTK